MLSSLWSILAEVRESHLCPVIPANLLTPEFKNNDPVTSEQSVARNVFSVRKENMN